jgi:arrestin-related trafficking adapter 9
MPLEALFSNSTPSIPRRSSLLSRFTAPLSNRNRNVAEFYVDPDDPWKLYFPSETVKGSVVLTITKPLPITHLVVCLHGHARVYKNQVVPGDGVAASGFLGPGRGSRGVEYLGNGFTSLFEDEVVLCGDGLLKKGIYKFKFELGFPQQRLPSSIDVSMPSHFKRDLLTKFDQFERGTVSYFVTATLTRPTTIAPTLSCDRRVLFQDMIDVGHTPIPKPRMISLEPISKRDMVKARVKQTSSDMVQESSSLGRTKYTEPDHSQHSKPSSANRPSLSPAPSDVSSTSAVTTSSQSFQIVNHPTPATGASTRNSETKSTSTSTSAKAITATVEVLRPGTLPGDVVPVKISISHTKPNVRGLVIVTLYRQGRIDMHPPIPLSPRNKGKRPEYEDVFPRSRTGLGGLHFSNSSPSSVFRKDLCQTSAMMIINPHTLAADVRASIRIPDDAFPTMANVPGGMIEFKYYTEVVIDVCGKLGESRFLPRISLTSPPQSFTNSNGNESGLQVTSNWADNILDTAQLRRGKNIIVCLFEITVGSKDSTRSSKRWNGVTPAGSQRSSNVPETHQSPIQGESYGDNEQDDEEYGYGGWPGYQGQGQEAQMHVPRFVPPPEPEEEVDEKTRLRREEALLLPSQPPEEIGPSSLRHVCAPSAPFIPEEEDLQQNRRIVGGEEGSYADRITPLAASTRSIDTIVPSYSRSYPSRVHTSNTDSLPDDKQELEWRRLMMQASAPPADADEGPSMPSGPSPRPSAPVVTEDDEYNAHTLNRDQDAGDHLPQYQQ